MTETDQKKFTKAAAKEIDTFLAKVEPIIPNRSINMERYLLACSNRHNRPMSSYTPLNMYSTDLLFDLADKIVVAGFAAQDSPSSYSFFSAFIQYKDNLYLSASISAVALLHNKTEEAVPHILCSSLTYSSFGGASPIITSMQELEKYKDFSLLNDYKDCKGISHFFHENGN